EQGVRTHEQASLRWKRCASVAPHGDTLVDGSNVLASIEVDSQLRRAYHCDPPECPPFQGSQACLVRLADFAAPERRFPCPSLLCLPSKTAACSTAMPWARLVRPFSRWSSTP